MSIYDLIRDLIEDKSPETRPKSPENSTVETRPITGGSPKSPESPTEREPVALRWTVLRISGDPVEVYLAPAGTAREAMRGIAGAITAIADPLLTVGCATCRNLKRPGLSDGYCSVRDDQPPAYGDTHPLRQIPEDRGVNCGSWESTR